MDPTIVGNEPLELSSRKERNVRLRVVARERGTYSVAFVEVADHAQERAPGRRYVIVSKSGTFASRDSEDFHWVANFPAVDPAEPTKVVVSIFNGLWYFASEDVCISYGTLETAEAPPQLPDWAPEWHGVSFYLSPASAGEADSISFETEDETLPAEVRPAWKQFYDAYGGVDGHEVSRGDIEDMENPPLGLTYGESHFVPTFSLLRRLGVGDRTDDVLVDLGSGTGRVVLTAALGFPGMRRCVGIELLPGLHAAALAAHRYLSLEDVHCAPVEFVQGDFINIDWSEATLVFAMSLCFPPEVIAELEHKALELRTGARLVTMHCFLGGGQTESPSGGASVGAVRLRPVDLRAEKPHHAVEMEMSFGTATLYVFEKVDLGNAADDNTNVALSVATTSNGSVLSKTGWVFDFDTMD